MALIRITIIAFGLGLLLCIIQQAVLTMTSGDGSSTEGSRYFDDDRFRRSFTLPASDRRPTGFKVTYADFGHHNDKDVMLFCPPLMGSRYLLTTQDKLAKKYGVRIISPDRPGFGGTEDVPLLERVQVWLEIVEALLQHLSIQHVGLVCYSAGSIYGMSVLLHQRHLLHPTRPYVAICTPWVQPAYSGVFSLKLVSGLPDALVGSFDRLAQFVQSVGGPVLSWSSDLVGSISSRQQGPGYLAPGVDAEDVAFEDSLGPEIFRRITAESIRGLGQDALFLLKRAANPDYWGSWRDHDTLVPLLAQAENERFATSSSTGSPLRVDVFFAESDHMIGTTTGPAWYINCWRPEQRGEHITFNSAIVPKTGHDHILELRYGVLERILRAMTDRETN